MARGTKAAKRGAVVDPWGSFSANPPAGSNQVKFRGGNTSDTHGTPNVGDARVGPNTKGTGKDGMPTARALAGKRKLGVKMPANF